MKKRNRVLAAMTAGVLMTVPVCAIQPENVVWTENSLTVETAPAAYPDAQPGSQQEKDALQVLRTLEIMQGDADGSFRPGDGITRAEVAKILLKMQNMPIMAYAESGFSDVPADHWAKDIIATVNQMQLMVGDGDGIFAPQRPVTTAEFSKVLVTMLGYASVAEAQGGYPDGYLRAAVQYLKAEKCIPGFAAAEELTRRDAAMLLYQALQTPLMENTTFGAPENATYVIYDGSEGTELITLLNRSFGIERK